MRNWHGTDRREAAERSAKAAAAPSTVPISKRPPGGRAGRSGCNGGSFLGSLLGVRATQRGKRKTGWIIGNGDEENSNGGERLLRRLADGFDK